MVKTKEEIKERVKEYHQSDKGKMCKKISQWKFNGLKCESRDEYELIYFTWLNSSRCENCNKEYTQDNVKCMDHCHDTGLFRNVLCNSCNIKRRTKENSSGIPNICWNKLNKCWRFQINIKGKIHSKCSKDLEWLKNYKIEYEKENLYI
tara:strand:+ start:56 stop:502 length:447 start_codon:yes stop_codon:yes gene_type:complete